MSPGTLYRRALRRVDRRAEAYRKAVRAGHAFQRANAHHLLVQSCRLANTLAMMVSSRDARGGRR